MAFEFHYSKPRYLIQALGCTAMLVFVGGFAYGSAGLYTLPDGGGMLTVLRVFFAVLILLAAAVALYGLVQAVTVVATSAPAVSCDGQTIRLGRKHRFDWPQIGHIEYVVRKRNTRTEDIAGRRQLHFLYVQPQQGRKVKFDISFLDAPPDEIVRSIHRAAPHIHIKGWHPDL
ncbi:hypothetical protein [Neisseria sp.]|uniref:hypothetical protein n=1 Tax=Neisseria sp. TaxID=192066 RepID=UPI00359F698E